MAEPDRLEAASQRITTFLEGLMGLPSSLAAAQGAPLDPAYRKTPLGDVQVLMTLDDWNGTAAFRKVAGHAVHVRLEVATEDRAQVQQALQAIGKVLDGFFAGRPGRYPPLEGDDHRGFDAKAFVGFGPGFFWSRSTGRVRFGLPEAILPRRLRQGAQLMSGAHPPPGDLYVALEADNRSLALEGAQELCTRAAATGWLAVVDVLEAHRRPDGRNLLGFPGGLRNPTVETRPPAGEVALCSGEDEAPELAEGSYLALLTAGVDLNAWRRLDRPEQEHRLGLDLETGEPLVPVPRGSFAELVLRDGAPLAVRRSMDYGRIGRDGSIDWGLSYQVFQRDPVSQLAAVWADGLQRGAWQPGGVGHLFKLAPPALFFLPQGTFSSYPGHPFFAPDLFRQLHLGLMHLFEASYEAAIQCFEEVIRQDPTFLWAHSVLVECLHDVQQLPRAARVLDAARKVDARNHLVLEQSGWQHYLEGDYARAAELSLQAVSAYTSDSHRSYPYHDLGAALLMLGDLERSELAFRRAVARVNLVAKNCYGLGNALEAQGRSDEARKIYDRTVEVAQYLIERQQISARDVRTTLDLAFIAYQGPAALETRERIRLLLQGPR